MQGEDGKKFKTRAGETVRLVDVLEEARDKARAILVARREAGTTSLSTDEEIEHAAAVLGYGGVKYFDLRQVGFFRRRMISAQHCAFEFT